MPNSKKLKLTLKYKKKKLTIQIKKLSFVQKGIGLMFKFYPEKTDNLLFEFKSPIKRAIHSFFVFFDFLAVWLDKDNEVLEWRIVNPFNPIVKPQNRFSKLIEIPLCKKNKGIINFFVGKRKI